LETVRIEHGEFGDETVPAHAYYGIRTKHALERMMHTGRQYKDDLLTALAALKKCAASVEVDAGRLDPRLGRQIERAAQEIMDGRWHEQFVFEPNRCGNGELLTLNMNEVLANRAMELIGEDKGSYHILRPDWHADTPLHPGRFFSGAFQLAALDYVISMERFLAAHLPVGMRNGITPVLASLKDRLCIINSEHFEPEFVRKLAASTGYPMKTGRTVHNNFETVYDKISSSMKWATSGLEPALQQLDSAELKACVIQIAAFHDMISFMTRSGCPAQGMEEVSAYYAWQCMDLFYQSLLQLNKIYH
jgi:hypothetical protein